MSRENKASGATKTEDQQTDVYGPAWKNIFDKARSRTLANVFIYYNWHWFSFYIASSLFSLKSEPSIHPSIFHLHLSYTWLCWMLLPRCSGFRTQSKDMSAGNSTGELATLHCLSVWVWACLSAWPCDELAICKYNPTFTLGQLEEAPPPLWPWVQDEW